MKTGISLITNALPCELDSPNKRFNLKKKQAKNLKLLPGGFKDSWIRSIISAFKASKLRPTEKKSSQHAL